MSKVKAFTPVFDAVTKETDMLASLVFGYIWRKERLDDGWCDTAIATMANDLGVSAATIKRRIDMLESAEPPWIEDLDPSLRNAPHRRRTIRHIEIVPMAAEVGHRELPVGQSELPEVVHRDTRRYLIKDNMRKRRDPLLDHPAIVGYKSIVHLHVPVAWRQEVAATIGEKEADVTRWLELVRGWVGRGWNKQNVAGMLEAFRKGATIQTQQVAFRGRAE